jgi:hypothetical protein
MRAERAIWGRCERQKCTCKRGFEIEGGTDRASKLMIAKTKH